MHRHAGRQPPTAGAVEDTRRTPLGLPLQKGPQRRRAQPQGLPVHVHEHRPMQGDGTRALQGADLGDQGGEGGRGIG